MNDVMFTRGLGMLKSAVQDGRYDYAKKIADSLYSGIFDVYLESKGRAKKELKWTLFRLGKVAGGLQKSIAEQEATQESRAGART